MNVHSQLIRAQLERLAADPSDPQDGHIYWNTVQAAVKVFNGEGSLWQTLKAPINYIENDGAEASTNGWAAYADAAAATPADGTGGSPTVTITRTESTPLRGSASFVITKDAVDRQGEGASYDFLIDNADKGQVLSVKFDYEVSGLFTTGGSSDVQIYLYDVTNAGLIALSNNTIDASAGRFDATFTAAATSNSYRLIYHIATTSANAWTMKFDTVTVDPKIATAQTVIDVPVGTILDYGATAAPSGFLLCDGAEVSRATFSALFSTIGTTFGAGNGSTTFNVPDLRGRVPVGKDDMGGVAANRMTSAESGVDGVTLGASGGAETHQLTDNELPSHDHGPALGTHTHDLANFDAENITVTPGGTAVLSGEPTSFTTTATDLSHSHAIVGTDITHQNTQPSLIVTKIIKT